MARDENAIADRIMACLHETVEEYVLPSHIRFGQKVESSDRDSREVL